MVHVEDQYISDGEIDWDGALADKYGIAVLAILFDVDDQKPQVITMIQFKKVNKCTCFNCIFSNLNITF